MRILFLAVDGDVGANLNLDEEYRAIDASVARQPTKLELVSKWAVRKSELRQGLLQHGPDVVHFAGHGAATGELMLRDDAGVLSPVSIEAVGALFAILRDDIKLVVLNACFSEAQAAAVRDSVGIAIGMRRRIADRSAIAFSSALYDAIAYGRSVAEAFQLGVAAIKAEGAAGDADVAELLLREGVDATASLQPTRPRVEWARIAAQTAIALVGAAAVVACVRWLWPRPDSRPATAGDAAVVVAHLPPPPPPPVQRVRGTVRFRSEELPAGRVLIAGTACQGDIHDGYFEIPCDGISFPVTIRLRLPELYAAQVCGTEIVLAKLSGNDVSLTACPVDAGGGGPSHTSRPCLIDGDNKPRRWSPGSCARPTITRNDTLTADYKRRFPELGGCSDVVEYKCPH